MYARALRARMRGQRTEFVAEVMAVSVKVLQRCMDSPAWRQASRIIEPDVRDDNIIFTSAIASLALEKTYERLEKGNEHVTKDGTIVMLEVPAGEAAAIADRFMDRHDKLVRQRDGVPEPDDAGTLRKLFEVADVLAAAGRVMAERAETNVTPAPPPIEGDALVLEVEADEA